MITWRRGFAVASFVLFVAGAGPVAAQIKIQPAPSREIHAAAPWRMRLLEIDRLLRLGSYSRAASMLDEADLLGAPPAQLRRLRIDLHFAKGNHETVVELCRTGLAAEPGRTRLLRTLAQSLMILGRIPEAHATLRDLFAASPNRISSVADAMLLWRGAGHPAEGLALCDSLRAAHGNDRIFMRHRAACLLDMARVEDAVAEIARELRLNPLNLPMVREELWELLDTPEMVTRAVEALAAEDDFVAELRLLSADLLLQLGRDRAALDTVTPLFATRRDVEALLRIATTLTRELELQDDREHQRATAAWLIAVFGELVDGDLIPRNQQARLADLLAGVCEDALELGFLDEDPERAVAKLEAALKLVRQRSPGSTRLYAARIKLAGYTRDVLRRPREAAQSLDRLLVDLDLPLEGVALARLALGECHLAAGDSVLARMVLSRLGRNPQFSAAAGHAHYLLGRLDFAQGAWANARDRLAAVALDNPSTDYANDALDLGLLIAEELSNPTGSPQRLEAYAPCVYWELARRPVYRQEALEHFLAANESAAGSDDNLLDRVRLDLAPIYAESGWVEQAASLCGAVVREHPDGARAAAALYRQGEILVLGGRVREGREVWERLLVQYPYALEAEDARVKLRSLP